MNGLVFGRRRQGKSTLARFLARSKYKTVVYFDPNAQFRGLPHQCFHLDEFAEWLEDPRGEIVFRPDPREIETQFDEFVELLWPRGNYALVLDEASCLQNSHGTHPQLERLMRQAPRDGARNANGQIVDVGIIQTIHRPSDANTICRALATDQFFFQAQLRRDLDVVENQFGERVAAALPELARFHCVHVWSDLDGRIKHSCWSDPSRWYNRIGPDTPGSGPGNASDHRTDPEPGDGAGAGIIGRTDSDPVNSGSDGGSLDSADNCGA